ncbi:MAG: M23 family metallopeptidase [Oscillospiraceae bacterium]|nr:M23 family metallopeptidase [Oscillospiraceae bacterium]
MQNNNKPSGFRRFLRENGYYLVIGLCVLAIGVSGFFLIRGSNTSEAGETLSVPVTVKTEDAQEPANAEENAAAAEEQAEEAIAEVPPADTAEAVGALTPEETVPTIRQVVYPVSGETIGAYSMATLAYNTTTRDWRTHDGIDLSAEIGTTVSATEDGTVSAVYADDYLGTTVEISHASGYTTVYANLAVNPSVSVGQQVSAGDAIGTVGDTALLELGSAPHLHFAVLCGGESVDPSDYLS